MLYITIFPWRESYRSLVRRIGIYSTWSQCHNILYHESRKHWNHPSYNETGYFPKRESRQCDKREKKIEKKEKKEKRCPGRESPICLGE